MKKINGWMAKAGWPLAMAGMMVCVMGFVPSLQHVGSILATIVVVTLVAFCQEKK